MPTVVEEGPSAGGRVLRKRTKPVLPQGYFDGTPSDDEVVKASKRTREMSGQEDDEEEDDDDEEVEEQVIQVKKGKRGGKKKARRVERLCDNPCDRCVRTKSKCVDTGRGDACVVCKRYKQKCTNVVRDMVRAKGKRKSKVKSVEIIEDSDQDGGENIEMDKVEEPTATV